MLLSSLPLSNLITELAIVTKQRHIHSFQDSTAAHYMFQDDPYLTPRTSAEFKLYSLSQESGRLAAKHIVNTNPKFFQKDFAEPHIPCLMPETMEPRIEDVSEAALLERIMLRKVKAAVDMYDQLLQAGTTVSTDATNDLLDLICLYGDHDPLQDDKPEELLKQMNEQKVKPNLLTFNAVLKALRRCGSLARAQSLHTLSEMKALGITPSLASFHHVLGIFYKTGNYLMLTEVAGRSFVPQDPDDVYFFSTAMRICLETKDLESAYRVHNLLNVGENWRLLGDSFQQSIYYGRFFNLLCMMEHIDVVLKWYNELIPSLFYPNPQGMKDLLQALDTDNRLDMIPQIWKDIRRMGHDNKSDLVEELLSLMARDRHSPEVQESFAACALDVRSLYKQGQVAKVALEWTTASMTNITTILLAAQKTKQAWDMLNIFKTKNRVPSEELIDEFLVRIKDGQQAVELVQISASFCLPSTPNLAQRVLQEFELSEEQRYGGGGQKSICIPGSYLLFIHVLVFSF
uniref:Small ribosomal subunit protein mS39 n=1 Tax=Esox lucius TaxID=8010 RepID=A0AAY5L9Q7_ESOLU